MIFKYKKYKIDQIFIVKEKGYVLISFYNKNIAPRQFYNCNNIFGKVIFWWCIGDTLDSVLKCGAKVEYVD